MTRSRLRIAYPLSSMLLCVAIPVRAQALPDWVAVDSAAHRVVLTLVAAEGPEPGTATISGHRAGDVQLVIPQGWTVQWNWRNADTTQSHSLVVMAEREKLPPEGGQPAIDGALSRMVKVGLKAGQKDEATFVAEPGGWYWLLCGVPGHALEGEWIGLRVNSAAVMVSVKLKN
ncbi:MAG: sulfocyanin-like copper-binding protein [Gemmatimonadales bacterium]